MLSAYTINGSSCELLIDQDALIWWPRLTSGGGGGGGSSSSTSISNTTTSVKSNNLSSPIRHLRSQLSRGVSSSSNAAERSPTSQFGGSGGSDADVTVDEFIHRRRRRIDFGQIVGVTKVHAKRRGSSKKNRASDRNRNHANIDGETLTTPTTTANQQSDSETREASLGEVPSTNSPKEITTKLKIYYAKRNEKKSTGRLLKLKKITIELLPLQQASPERGNHLGHATTTEHVNLSVQSSPVSSSSTSSTATSPSTSQCQPDFSALNDLYELIDQHLELKRRQRPRRLLVFVNPYGGKGKAFHLYKSKVRKILDLAQIECQLVVTKYANHARNTIEDPLFNLESFDGIICIGGDGMFAELMNGLLFRFNRDKMLANELNLMNRRLSDRLCITTTTTETETTATSNETNEIISNEMPAIDGPPMTQQQKTGKTRNTNTDTTTDTTTKTTTKKQQLDNQLKHMRSSLGGIGEQFQSPNIPIGVIGAGSTDANLFGFIGTNDTVSATLNIVLGNQIQIDVCSIHSIQEDRLLRFVSTFVAYGYFGDVIRESEKYRWLGPSRYDLTALNSLIKYRYYDGLVRILRSKRDGTPLDLNRCHLNCGLCKQQTNNNHNNNDENNDSEKSNNNNNHFISSSFNFDKTLLASGGGTKKDELADPDSRRQLVHGGDDDGSDDDEFEIIEEDGSFVGVNAAVTACRCPQTRKGFSPGNHLANGCADLILVRPCTRMQYINYLIRTGYTSKSAFDLRYVDAYRCRQFEFIVKQQQQQQHHDEQPSDDRKTGDSGTTMDDMATSDYQSKGSTKLSTNDTSIASSRQSSNANSLDSKQFVQHSSMNCVADSRGHQQKLRNQPENGSRKENYTTTMTVGGADNSSSNDHTDEPTNSSSWNADGEILREQSIRVKVNYKLLRVFGTGEPQPRTSRCQRKQQQASRG
uniref:Ceramide kinase n=1 Tax=Aceria tosichella TaxID=561515 RepID=A0A6G1S8B1_9ACAR